MRKDTKSLAVIWLSCMMILLLCSCGSSQSSGGSEKVIENSAENHPNVENSVESTSPEKDSASSENTLKWKIRTGWKIWMIRGRRESISEHCHGCLILANLLYPYHPDKDNIDLNRVNLMLIWHEIGEKKIGDVPEIDRKRHGSKAEAEHAAWKELLSELPKEQAEFIYDLLMEFDAHETPESKFAYYIDKIEANKQMKHYVDAGRTWSLKWIRRFRRVIRKDAETTKIIRDGAKTPAEVFMADAYHALGRLIVNDGKSVRYAVYLFLRFLYRM